MKIAMKVQPKAKKVKKTNPAAVAIAKDVLKQISLYANVGGCTYVDQLETAPKSWSPDNTKSAQPVIGRVVRLCNVCALGACFLSYVKLHNKFTIGELFKSSGWDTSEIDVDRWTIVQKLKGIFTSKELDAIEGAFEGLMISYDAGYQFYQNYGARSDRRAVLRAIMKNIIANDGFFKPEKDPMYVKG